MLADPYTKPISGPTLKIKNDWAIGPQYNPPEDSAPCKLLFNAPEVSISNMSSSKKAKPTKLLQNLLQ
eukprot:9702625-Ditylum_brightwellii.AAC.1